MNLFKARLATPSPNSLRGTDEGQPGYFSNQYTIITGNSDEIIPFSCNKHMNAFLAYRIHIISTYRQVRIYLQSLSFLRSIDFLDKYISGFCKE